MNTSVDWIVNFIWGIADDVLRDLYVRGKYRDVILPMIVLRRLDAVLEPSKQALLDMKASLDTAKIVHQDQALRQAAGQAFYNTSKFTMRDLKSRTSQQRSRPTSRRTSTLLAERAGHLGELRVPQPDPPPFESRRARHADRETAIARHQPEPQRGVERRRRGVNGFPSGKIADKIQEDPYRFLICADKFQTGYDEPLLL